MTDVEAVLRERLHAGLDDLEPSTMTARDSLRSGRRARRRRTTLVSVATAVVLLAAGVTGGVLLGRNTSTPDVVATGDLSDRTVTYAEQFRDGDFASIRTDMTPEVRSQLPESVLRKVWQEALTTLGPLVRITPAVKDTDATATYLSPLHFRGGNANLRVMYDGAGRVIGLTLLNASVETLDVVPPELASTSGQVVDDLAQGRYEDVRARFDNRMASELSVTQLRDGWQQAAVRQHGGFVSRGGMTATKVRGFTVVDVFCTMKRGELRVRISYDDTGLIAGLLLTTQ